MAGAFSLFLGMLGLGAAGAVSAGQNAKIKKADYQYGEEHGLHAKFFRDTKSELKKVVWPSKEDTKTNTVVVLVTVAIAAVVMIALDAIFGGILGLIIGA